MWTQQEAINLCVELEKIAPRYGAHIALTGGLLYKEGSRKDCDIVVYRIRQWPEVDFKGFFKAISFLGIRFESDHGWCKKATWLGKNIDFFDPDASGEYGEDDIIGDEVPF